MPSAADLPPKILLLGNMGSGKTSVGIVLAADLQRPYVDNDDLVEEVAGAAKATLVRTRGEHALRVAEAAVVDELLRRPGPMVAGVPAGTVLDAEVRSRLAGRADDTVLVWLRVQVETVVRRLEADPADRPWLDMDHLEASVRALLADRDPHFAELADVVIDVDEGTPAELAREVVAALTAHARQ